MIYEYEYPQKQKASDMGKCNGKVGVSPDMSRVFQK
jgi:hypothetical protein